MTPLALALLILAIIVIVCGFAVSHFVWFALLLVLVLALLFAL